jgi:hypothetical protein
LQVLQQAPAYLRALWERVQEQAFLQALRERVQQAFRRFSLQVLQELPRAWMQPVPQVFPQALQQELQALQELREPRALQLPEQVLQAYLWACPQVYRQQALLRRK